MLANPWLLFLLVSACWPGLEASQCDLFHNEHLCSLDTISNIVGTITGLENEVVCQNQCVLDSSCRQFMFIAFKYSDNKCFLLTQCKPTTKTCDNTPGCSQVITGPKTPSLKDACCDDLQEVTCESESEIGHFFDIANSTECQSLCQETAGCRYWSLYGQICFLYSRCKTPNPCSLCTSGSVFPNCESDDFLQTILLGGWTSNDYYSTSVELVTPDQTCTPEMDHLPVGRVRAAASMLGSRVFYCGGYDHHQYHKSCYSYDLNTEGGVWHQEGNMVKERRSFGLTAVGQSLYATGGYFGSSVAHSSVEVFTDEEGWRQEPELEMRTTKYLHCSVAIGSWLYTIGGIVQGTSEINTSNLVEAFDTMLLSSNSSKWVQKTGSIQKRYGHGCHTGFFKGQEGIYVAGGFDGKNDLASAEFYNAADDSWSAIGSLQTARPFLQMTLLGEQMIVSGGGKPDLLTSVEIFDGSSWVESSSLTMGRSYHAAVSFRASGLKCKMETTTNQPGNNQPRMTFDFPLFLIVSMQVLHAFYK